MAIRIAALCVIGLSVLLMIGSCIAGEVERVDHMMNRPAWTAPPVPESTYVADPDDYESTEDVNVPNLDGPNPCRHTKWC